MEKVRNMLQNSADKPSQKLKMVDTIQRSGVSYHFESEIEEILQNMHENPSYYIDKDAEDLYTIALWFRLLRQQGYKISCGKFNCYDNLVISTVNDMLIIYYCDTLKRYI